MTKGRAGRLARSLAAFGIIQIALSAAREFAIWRLDARVPFPTQVCEEPTMFWHAGQGSLNSNRQLTPSAELLDLEGNGERLRT